MHDKGMEMSKVIGVTHAYLEISSAGSGVENVKRKRLKDRKFRKSVNECSHKLIEGQPET